MKMKFFERMLSKSSVIDQLLKDDLQQLGPDRTSVLSTIEKLNKDLNNLPLDKLQQAEEAVINAGNQFEKAKMDYSNLTQAIESNRREITKAIQAEQKRLEELTPMAVHQVANDLQERLKSAGPLSATKINVINQIFQDINALVRVVDEKILMSSIVAIESRIQAVFS